jgi:flagellar secretion chaperone FliS
MSLQRIDSYGKAPSTSDSYLQAMVTSASPSRLRLMLIERGIGLAHHLAEIWQHRDSKGTNPTSIHLLDILSELLAGVTGSSDQTENEVCQQVADLYVFLIQHLSAAEGVGDANAAREVASVLEIEAETWRAVCAKETGSQLVRSGGAGLNFSA